jgi:predicted nucleic acid-binding protein
MPEPEASPIIFDNTVLSNFALVQAFDILRQLYEVRAFICRAVLQEIQAGIDSGWKYPWLRGRTRLQVVNQALDEGWLQIPRSEVNPGDDIGELQLALEYGQRFGAGEAEAMAIARTRGWVFASDDGAARRFAKEHSIRLTGTLGILVKATSVGILSLSDADGIHARMIDEGYRSPLPYENGISSFLNRLNE